MSIRACASAHLRGNTGYDAWLTGAQAQAAWVASSEAAIVSK